MTLGRTLGLQNPGCRAGCLAHRIMNLHENQPKRVLLASFTPGETEKQFSKYHCYLGVETRLDPRGLFSRAQEEVSPPAEEGKVRGHFGQAARGRGAVLALFLGSTGRWAPPSDPEPPGPGCRGEGETLGRVLSPAADAGLAARAPGSLPAPDGESREGLICRKTFSSDLVSGSGALLPGVGRGSSQHPSPGPRLGEKQSWR